MAWVNLAEGVNLDYLEKRKAGDILGFKQEHTIQYYKIKRINKKSKKYWAERVNLYKPEEVGIVDK